MLYRWLKDRLFYGWVVAVAGLIICTILSGTRYSFGVFFKSIEADFDLSRAATSGVFSVYMVLCSATAVLGGWAVDKYGPKITIALMGFFTGLALMLTSQTNALWQLFITYSLLLSLGAGAIWSVLMAAVSKWFDRKRGFAFSIVGAGSGFGLLVVAPLATYLIVTFNWRVAIMVMGVIALVVIIGLSLIIKTDPREVGALPDGAKPGTGKIWARDRGVQEKRRDSGSVSFSLLQAFRMGSFWILWVRGILWSVCWHLVVTHVVPHATDVGISPTAAGVILSLVGAAGIPARLIMGRVTDVMGTRAPAVVCALLMSGAMVWLIWAKDPWMFYLFAVCFGIGWGGFDPPTVALISDIFGQRNLGAILGAWLVAWGIGAAVGPLIGGFVFDVSGSYVAAFLIGAVSMLITAILAALPTKK